jgi:hypothetical protein
MWTPTDPMPLRCLTLAGLTLGLALPLSAQPPPDELPRLGVAEDDASVLGVSSGGYMATQLAVAWPERFDGLAVLGAGPWSCAQGALSLALGQCMTDRLGEPDLDELSHRLADYRERGLVGSREALAELRVFVWHGREDALVEPALGRALVEQFHAWLADPEGQLRFVETDDAGHGWPVLTRADTPVDILAECRRGGGTHLLACDLDIAGEALGWLHDAGERPAGRASTEGQLRAFDQSDFDAKGLAGEGFLFVPRGCEDGNCPLSVALHGCSMDAEQTDEAFVRHSGLNEWAAERGRVILYPQAESSLANPQGCWDWWGFAESTWQLDPLHDTRDGTQITALMAMIEHLQEGPDA